ncbi:hypothetical protein NDU88_003191 [Pleurodeles waltl]|uniref:Uncharacterized protein n=1 Tax=Pleurodeles waltl TaxID=8319 RepID=A0AAV7SFQ9_PLEWA|nr:hypothetical protein NDU88_003191 [Pleurodeles waltl]
MLHDIQVLRDDIKSPSNRLTEAGLRISTLEDSNYSILKPVDQSSHSLKSMVKELSELEDRTRRWNLHIFGLPENIENNASSCIELLEPWMPHTLGLTFTKNFHMTKNNVISYIVLLPHRSDSCSCVSDGGLNPVDPLVEWGLFSSPVTLDRFPQNKKNETRGVSDGRLNPVDPLVEWGLFSSPVTLDRFPQNKKKETREFKVIKSNRLQYLQVGHCALRPQNKKAVTRDLMPLEKFTEAKKSRERRELQYTADWPTTTPVTIDANQTEIELVTEWRPGPVEHKHKPAALQTPSWVPRQVTGPEQTAGAPHEDGRRGCWAKGRPDRTENDRDAEEFCGIQWRYRAPNRASVTAGTPKCK